MSRLVCSAIAPCHSLRPRVPSRPFAAGRGGWRPPLWRDSLRRVRFLFFCLLTSAFCLISSALAANSAPQVSNVRASQRNDASRLVDIYYNLADADGDACTIWVAVSNDAGQSWGVGARSFSGAVGIGNTPSANKHVVWDAGADIPGKIGQVRVRVFADDGNGPASMVLVPAGPFPYQGGPSWIQVDTFVIDKYEVTNQFYCQFLNNGQQTESRWNSSMEIDRFGQAGAYTYTVQAGRDKYPVRYVSFYDAEAFAAWRSASTGQNYRLPTEQEWEKAAGWDPSLNKLFTYGFHQDVIDCTWCNFGGCKGSPTTVGFYNGVNAGTKDAKSYYGCYDMSGNLWEWTNSWYTVNSTRVIRGGYWNYGEDYCRVTSRNCYAPSGRYGDIGFRLVLDLN